MSLPGRLGPAYWAAVYGPDGFRFFTGYAGRKAGDLEANPQAALLWHWPEVGRQVRVEGRAERLPRDEVEAYFAVRPRGSQLGAHASAQSQPVADRTALEAAYAAAEREFEGREVTPPEQWGGYRVRPEVVELWQGRPSRLHDRFEYRRAGDGWTVRRLQP